MERPPTGVKLHVQQGRRMERSAKAGRVLRFEAFEVDLEERELRRSGVRIKIQEQPFQILVLLLERPGAVC